MLIKGSKLIANRSNALKSTGPRSEAGKRQSAVNSRTHGLNSLLITGDAELEEGFSLLVSDATRLGYSEQDARAVVATLQLGRAVIHAKHRADQDKSGSEKVEALTRREWIQSIRETQILESQMA